MSARVMPGRPSLTSGTLMSHSAGGANSPSPASSCSGMGGWTCRKAALLSSSLGAHMQCGGPQREYRLGRAAGPVLANAALNRAPHLCICLAMGCCLLRLSFQQHEQQMHDLSQPVCMAVPVSRMCWGLLWGRESHVCVPGA